MQTENAGREGRKTGNGFRFNLFELGGALGDLGTLLPLAIALITLNGMSTTSVFLVVGLSYVTAGLFYRLPMPVQPLKAVAAIAIAGGLSASVVSASGLVMAVVLLLLSITGTIGLVSRLFPRAVIRGIQLGLALFLVKAGLFLVARKQVIVGGNDSFFGLANLNISAGWLLAAAFGVVFVMLLRSRKVPASLAVLGLGIAAGMFWGSFPGLKTMHFGLSLPSASVPSLANLTTALVLLVIPQIPLTLGNAVFATQDTARIYFGTKAKRVTPRALTTTMGLSNLAAGLLGGMPVCHGSGGLTAHYRLGARTGAAGLMLGALFVTLAVFVDGNALPILSLIPYSVLGVLVVFVGVQHGLLVRDLRGAPDIAVVSVIAIMAVITGNLAIGFGSGMALHFLLKGMSKVGWLSRGRIPARQSQELG